MKYKKTFGFLVLISAFFLIGLITFNSLSINNKVLNSGVSLIDSGQKKVYLTFDDGPSYKITPKILDVLEKNKVKATFFVVGCQIANRKGILKRIYSEGHSIGLHTFSHQYITVYRSNNVFLNEMEKTAGEIYKVLGISPKIIRFPGGSKKHLTAEFQMRIKEHGYKIFDWNISAADGFNNNIPADNIYQNCIKNNEKFTRVIITLHCAAENIETTKALPRIIKYYKNEGYSFETIKENTPEYYFKF